MHELSVCQALIDQLRGIATGHRAHRIARVRLVLGPLSGVEPDLLQRAWPLASAGGIAAGAELVLEPAPVRVHCDRCGRDSEATANRLLCGHCGDWRTRLVSGDELMLKDVELLKIEETARCVTAADAM